MTYKNIDKKKFENIKKYHYALYRKGVAMIGGYENIY